VADARRELASRDRIRGEITLLVAPPGQSQSGVQTAAPQKIAVRIAQLQAEAGIDEKEALKRLARELGQSKSDVYRELQRERARLTAASRGTRNTL
jgi:16S rRNA (cytidine1402-2'-O)-methyltransferase